MIDTAWRRRLMATCLIFGLLADSGLASEPPPARECRCLADLRCLSPCELEQLYARCPAGPCPTGFMRGDYLYQPGARMPHMKSRMTGMVWKGKHFNDQGDFINQFAGFRAIHSHAAIGSSWF